MREACPYYLSIGMTYDEYWRGTPYMVIDYRKADRLKRQNENTMLWLQGRYIYDALNNSAIMHALGSKQKLSYPKEPYEIMPKTKAEAQAEAEKARQKVIQSLTAWKNSWDKQNQKEMG